MAEKQRVPCPGCGKPVTGVGMARHWRQCTEMRKKLAGLDTRIPKESKT